jgi:beta-lactamase class A
MTVRRWIGVAAALLTLSTGCSSSAESEPADAAPRASTTATPTTTSPPPDLQAVLDAFADDQSVPFSVVAVDLATGARGERLADRQVPSASLYKLFVARELLRRIDVDDLDRDAPAHDGEGRTVGECIEAMIVVSDNRCGAAGLNAVGHGAIDAELHEAGFVSTSLGSPQRTSAADVALFLARARDGTLLGTGGEDVTAELYGLLRTQEVNDRLPLGLAPGTPIAHKTGDILHWAHDAGIVTTPTGELLVVVLSGPWPSPCCDADHPGKAEAKAFGAIAQLATQLYAAVS